VRLCEKRRIQVASYFVERIGKVKPEDIWFKVYEWWWKLGMKIDLKANEIRRMRRNHEFEIQFVKELISLKRRKSWDIRTYWIFKGDLEIQNIFQFPFSRNSKGILRNLKFAKYKILFSKLKNTKMIQEYEKSACMLPGRVVTTKNMPNLLNINSRSSSEFQIRILYCSREMINRSQKRIRLKAKRIHENRVKLRLKYIKSKWNGWW
jgi:hypothetical protein